MRIATQSILPAVALAMGCGQSTSAQSMTALAQSGALSVICRDMDTGRGLDITACPDPNATSSTGRHTLLMVTQTGRGEVAVIDMTAQSVVDEDPAAPGKEFLPVGAMPVSVASTPGGASTFVATAEPGREAIFVLPTSCVTPPEVGEPSRDLTQWSACKLPVAPGEMVIIPDPTNDSSGGFRKSCDATSAATINETSRVDCPADWDADERISPSGRRKVLVTLPTLGGVALLDARSLYGLQPGAFEACHIERWLPLSTQVPASIDQPLPDDLKTTSPSSGEFHYFGPTQTSFVSNPAGISFKDGHLYVADLGVPLVHDLNWSDPCKPRESAPLTPTSLEEPGRSVLTSAVAVSDLTLDNKRFVYAVDDALGTLMAFDVSSNSLTRAPLVFPGSPYLPYSPPDRISTNVSNARARDVLFVTHDVPYLSEGTATASTRTRCDPTPTTEASTDYRTSSDYSTGASPSKLRGIFAMVALSDGHVSVVDVEDWDQPCRRPVENNTSAVADWRGCKNDYSSQYIDTSGDRTVSDEASCNVIEPHHPRSGRFFATNSTVGTGAPTLSSFPTLATPSSDSAATTTSRTNSAPKLLAVPYAKANGVSEVQIGSTTYYLESYQTWTPGSQGPSWTAAPSETTYLDVSPAVTSQNSLVLPLVEPRSYPTSENFSLTYEGKLFDDRQSGLLLDTLTLSDPDAQFCNQGVQDSAVTLELAGEYIGTGDAANFASTHTDFVQLTSDFSDNDPYWVSALGSSCANDPVTGVKGINGCRSYFGTNLGIASNLKPTRELTIVEAYQDHLILQPRDGSTVTETNLHCCFPGTSLYTVRAANQWVFRGQQSMSRISPDSTTSRCIVDDNPRKAHLRNRAFEITSSDTTCDDTTNTCSCGASSNSSSTCIVGIGPSTANSACVVNNNSPINPNDNSQPLPSGCVFESLKARFAVYSGTLPSVRDMAFSWQVNGGFVPYQISLANRYTGSSVMPQSMTSAPNLSAFFVVDGVSGGVFEFVLDPFTINGNPYL